MIVTTDSILQGNNPVCGIICLYAVMRHLDPTISYESVLQSIETPFYSGTAKELVRITQKFNMNANVYKLSIKTLFELPPPFIIHWDSNHYVVYEGVEGETVYINDPLVGHTTMTKDNMTIHYTGYALLVC